MELKRFKDVIAVAPDSNFVKSDTIIAFHASNLEVAEISTELFNEMATIDLSTGQIPLENRPVDDEAHRDLINWNEEKNLNAKNGFIAPVIRSITINVNQICNLKCSYCAAGGDGTYGEKHNNISIEPTVAQLSHFMGKLPKHSKFAISLVGGEPLLHTEVVKQIHDAAFEIGSKFEVIPKIKVVTNGTLLNDQNLEILKKLNIELTISIDGVKAVNDRVRPSKDGSSTTEKIVEGIQKLKKDMGKIYALNFSSITSKDNDQIFENYMYLREFEPNSYEFVFANDEREKELQQKHIEGIAKILKYAWELGGEKELRKIKSVDHYFAMLDNQQRAENHCGAGKSYLMIDSKNRLYTCVWDANNKQESVGNNTTIDEKSISKLSKPLIELNNCQSCWARYLCGGGCMHIHKSNTGNKHTKSQLFCERTRSLILYSIMYYKLARSAQELS